MVCCMDSLCATCESELACFLNPRPFMKATFVSSDGTTFDTQHECLLYESIDDRLENLRSGANLPSGVSSDVCFTVFAGCVHAYDVYSMRSALKAIVDYLYADMQDESAG